MGLVGDFINASAGCYRDRLSPNCALAAKTGADVADLWGQRQNIIYFRK
jgi:hypothetical protein